MEKEKYCSVCCLVKPADQFSLKRGKTGIYHLQWCCKSCQKAYKDAHYRAHRDEYLKKKTERKAAYRVWWQELKSSLHCVRCGESHPACLEFHHLDPKTKEFTLGAVTRGRRSKERILNEIAKCIVLCSNCHKKEHYVGASDNG